MSGLLERLHTVIEKLEKLEAKLEKKKPERPCRAKAGRVGNTVSKTITLINDECGAVR